jgi:hypothetical protein
MVRFPYVIEPQVIEQLCSIQTHDLRSGKQTQTLQPRGKARPLV